MATRWPTKNQLRFWIGLRPEPCNLLRRPPWPAFQGWVEHNAMPISLPAAVVDDSENEDLDRPTCSVLLKKSTVDEW